MQQVSAVSRSQALDPWNIHVKMVVFR
jgi:hypothetical protein